ncbi:MAG: FecR domain-containing protein [Candidatus Aminicenantes bacterium]|nr:FecR domain-containing protein [Candidatus Aminicenantes bacterium]
MRKRLFQVLSLVISLVLFSFVLKAQESEPDERLYNNYSVARLSFLEGKAFVQRASDVGFEEAVINDPITEGDRISTIDGRLEIQFGRRNYLRLDSETKIDVLNLPTKNSELTRFRLWSGHAYLTVNNLDREKSIEVHTPDSSFYILEKGIYRFDVDENRGTEILVFRGLAEASGEQDSYLVKGEQRLEIAEGRFAGRPVSFRAVAEDSFDRWNESRNRETSKFYARRYLPSELEEFEAELSAYGDWVYVPPYGFVWVPRNVDDDWRPYYYGRWTWIPLTGWTWVPYEPWGWVAFHYGRWHWAVGIGWYWIPTSIWGPAWVSWWWDVDYFAWAPLSWYGHPVVIINNVFYDRYTGIYPVHSRALVVVRKDQLRAPDIRRVALKPDVLKSVRLENKITLSSTRLPFRPEGNRITVEKLDAKKVILRQDSQATGLRDFKPKSKINRGAISRKTNIKADNGKNPQSINPGNSSGQPKAVRPPARDNSCSKVNVPKSAPSGKVTPKKIRKKEDAPFTSQPSYRSENKRSTVPMYPSSPRISVDTYRKNYYPRRKSTESLKRSYPTYTLQRSETFSPGRIKSSRSSTSIRPYSSPSGSISVPKIVKSSSSSRSGFKLSGSRSSSGSSSISSGSIRRKK